MNAKVTDIDPIALSQMMGQSFPPTEQQAAVIGAPLEPMLVVAGAGAGKTATMAARVVWLVANGYIRPEQILGLTFTRKAARELGVRIRQQLHQLAQSREFRAVASPEVLAALEVIAPTTSTYDAYASEIVSNYGLLLPTEPGVSILDGATEWQQAWNIALAAQSMNSDIAPATLAQRMIALGANLDSNLSSVAETRSETEAFIKNIEQTPKASKRGGDLLADLRKVVDSQRQRLEILPFLSQLRATCDADNVATFAMQMARAARLASAFDEVSASEQRRFKVIMLDEYQDTSHTQRLFLRALFSGACVTAVGDPMQSIYGWRGATAENLAQFVSDFPRSDGMPAEKKQLTISWRNPSSVLDIANVISDSAFAGQKRAVERLQAGPKAGAGEVSMALLGTGEEEVTYIADLLEEEMRNRNAVGKTLDAAILVRTNQESASYLQALSDRGVPAVIVGLAGLLGVPEVMDITSTLRMLVDPSSDADTMRLLLSPRFNVGAADVEALRTRARQLAHARARQSVQSPDDESPLVEFARKLDELVEQAEDQPNRVGLAHAVADPDIRFSDGTPLARGNEEDNGPMVTSELLRFSQEGMRRIAELGATLRRLRRFSLSKPLPELVEDVAAEFGIRVEAAAGQFGESTAITKPSTIHLDRFVDIAAQYSQNNSDDVAAFLGYLDFAIAHDGGLERAPVEIPPNCVHIMTMHKAKGLEWDTVVVPRVTAAQFDNLKVESWIRRPELLPPGAITQVDPLATNDAGNAAGAEGAAAAGGFAASESVDKDAPELDISGVENQTELNNALKAYTDELRGLLVEEAQRLFYVAVTRAERKLIVTASLRPKPGNVHPTAPSKDFAAIAKAFPEYVDVWVAEDSAAGDRAPEETSSGHTASTEIDGVAWPADTLAGRREEVEAAARRVRHYLSHPGAEEPLRDDLSQVWESETSILLEELRRASAEDIVVELPSSISTSEYQALVSDPEGFARRKVRPVPFKPNRFARRGTAFHAWLENRFNVHSLLDDEDLYASGLDDFLGSHEAVSEKELSSLQANFEASEWAERTPEFVEVPFEISIGSRRIVGRIDAVFNLDGKWTVIDWKTGRPPKGKALRVAVLQLAIYRLAWSDRLREMGNDVSPEQIDAGFFYVGAKQTIRPDESLLPSRIELDRKMRELLD
nr:ATP-dependent DNA helicase [Corynebacterium lactis]